jgi:hypothetical protein
MEFNIYCDESCHLPKDQISTMVLGAIWLPKEEVQRISRQIRLIKLAFDLPNQFEVKWVKVSPSQIKFYENVINYFFDEPALHFRAVIISEKNLLDHQKFNQTHDDWYYKMYYTLLTRLISPDHRYNIYLDYKDTQGALKTKKLKQVLSNSVFDFNSEIIQKIQLIRSDESEMVQLTDLLIGLLGYNTRNLKTSSAKLRLIELFKERSHYSLLKSTLLREEKTNLFFWRAKCN